MQINNYNHCLSFYSTIIGSCFTIGNCTVVLVVYNQPVVCAVALLVEAYNLLL